MQVLRLWHRVMVAGLRADHPDFTARQLGLLLQVYLEPPPHTVRGLAAALGMSKPAVTRALDRLCADDFVRRKRDERDRRSVSVVRTTKGSVFLRDFGDQGAAFAITLLDGGLDGGLASGLGSGLDGASETEKVE